MDSSAQGALPEGTVTLLFTDIEGSTRLLDSLGDLYGTLLADHHRPLRAAWAEHGGIVVAARRSGWPRVGRRAGA